ncbi:MAG: hypothetical protein IMF06_15240 [Proteobacteria bacterium]|nr:hypothetical protein [Pseudomonadota bacterium]
MKKSIEEHEKVPLLLSKDQIDLIIEHTFAEDDLLDALRVAEVVGRRIKVLFTLHDLEDLNGHVAAVANHCEDRKMQNQFDAIYDAIQKVELKYDLR